MTQHEKRSGRMLPARSRSVERDPRWAAVLARDPAADDRFVYAVKTTGIYCWPSSPSRLPRPENVVFFDTAEAAEAAGYRPSKHVPKGMIAARYEGIVAAACRRMEISETVLTLDELASAAGMSPFHFHRVFSEITGLTPKAYARAQRARTLRSQLRGGSPVTRAIYDAGYGSDSRFYAESGKILGMRPRDYRLGGTGEVIRFAIGECSLGSILVARSAHGICAISLGEDPGVLAHQLQDQFPRAELIGDDADFERWMAQVVGLIESPASSSGLPLDIRGTVFQERVWQALRQIPPGTTMTYAEIAQRIGMPKAIRAVARACAANRLAVAIPCHRVVRSDGGVSGYRWGVERKRALLLREGSNGNVE
ncbi:MAG: bifunctional DNA-binding transcriptional regulator/O6-methylguanine-DNA methyltransferase Ada [Xanthomonadaceae bacterium]|jgi:AraC family transcriptional regulator of adaptative response/methylated-DNA-[protein]-cysteine methyltransferase|nr:bifunctional DNA-binding transcriptional regulator/O6-methylguanine-DNA methyltransferase Ada [Xanthomonadaceae bacterium]